MTRDRNRFGPHIPERAPRGCLGTDIAAGLLVVLLGALIVALVWVL